MSLPLLSTSSSLSDVGTDSPSSSLGCSRSCDLEVHEPITLEESQLVAKQPPVEKEGEPVVDEEAIHQSMELSQRLSLEALSEWYHWHGFCGKYTHL